MEDMMMSIIKKALPPEVVAMLSPEKLKELGDQINAGVEEFRGQLNRIETDGKSNAEALKRIEDALSSNQPRPGRGRRGGDGDGGSGDAPAT